MFGDLGAPQLGLVGWDGAVCGEAGAELQRSDTSCEVDRLARPQARDSIEGAPARVDSLV